MGTHAERVAISNQVSREDQDAFALASHQKAIAAIDAGRFDAETAPVTIRVKVGNGRQRRRRSATGDVHRALAALKPVFDLPLGEDRGTAERAP